MALLSTTLSYDDLGAADLVIEAVFEDMGVKEGGVQGAGPRDEARRHPGVQHLHAGRDKIAASRSARRTWSACTSSARPT
jgi:hypothetical protein